MNNHQTSTKKYEPQSSSDIITIVVQQNNYYIKDKCDYKETIPLLGIK